MWSHSPPRTDLEVGNRVSPNFTAYAVKAQIRYVMLPATVEAAADLNVQILNGLIELETFLRQMLPQYRCQSTRGGDSQLTGVGPRAGGNVDNTLGPRLAQTHGLQRLVKLRQVALADPANHEVLFDGCSDRFPW